VNEDDAEHHEAASQQQFPADMFAEDKPRNEDSHHWHRKHEDGNNARVLLAEHTGPERPRTPAFGQKAPGFRARDVNGRLGEVTWEGLALTPSPPFAEPVLAPTA